MLYGGSAMTRSTLDAPSAAIPATQSPWIRCVSVGGGGVAATAGGRAARGDDNDDDGVRGLAAAVVEAAVGAAVALGVSSVA